jgi:hypothetical protein
MIIGGSNGSTLLDTVELFNWKTLERCMMKSRCPQIGHESCSITLALIVKIFFSV